MARDVCIRVGLNLRPVEPDGAHCSLCEDAIYLRQWRYYTTVYHSHHNEVAPTAINLCESCVERMSNGV